MAAAFPTTFRTVATGLAFPEGPVVLADGSLVVTEIALGRLTRVHDDGRTEVYAEVGGGANGAAVAADGSVYVCNNGGRWPLDVPSTAGAATPPNGPGSIQRVAPDGTVTTVLDAIDGRPLDAPNDGAFGPDGGLWFTDPVWASGRLERSAGSICYLGPDGSARRAHTGLQFPNGIGVSDDGRFLYVAESMTGSIVSFRIEGPGVLGDPKPNGLIGRRSVPDGFCADSAGRLIVAGHQTPSLFVLDAADGRPVAVVDVGATGPTNCCFGGPDGRTLYVTSSDRGEVLALDWPVPGMALHPRG